jgi:hypothetical protein
MNKWNVLILLLATWRKIMKKHDKASENDLEVI